MMGYAADMCLISTTAGYKNVSKDFNCFVVGDATLATFPALESFRWFNKQINIIHLSLRKGVADQSIISNAFKHDVIVSHVEE